MIKSKTTLTDLIDRASLESDITIENFTKDCSNINHKMVNLQILKNQKTILSVLSTLLYAFELQNRDIE